MISLLLLFSALVYNFIVNDGSDRMRVNIVCLVPLALFTAVYYFYPDMGDRYYFLACVLSLLVIVVLGIMKRSPLSTHIQIVNMVAMTIHLYGLYCFYNYLDDLYYIILIMFAITYEWLRLMIRTKSDGVYWSALWLRGLSDNDSGSSKRGDT